MERKIELGWLFDFYGAMLTEHRREIMRMYLEEDLTLQEIADAIGVTRQCVHDAIRHGSKQLEEYEEKLGLLKRYQDMRRAVVECRRELEIVKRGFQQEDVLDRALAALDLIEAIER